MSLLLTGCSKCVVVMFWSLISLNITNNSFLFFRLLVVIEI